MFDRKVREQLKEVEHKLEILETYLIVKDPGTARSAEAYDGLRKLMVKANRDSQIHLAHLAELDDLLLVSDDTELARSKIGEFLAQIGIERITSTDLPEAFEISGSGKGDFEVDRPAYVDTLNRQIVRRGAAHFADTDDESGSDDSAGVDKANNELIGEATAALPEEDHDREATP